MYNVYRQKKYKHFWPFIKLYTAELMDLKGMGTLNRQLPTSLINPRQNAKMNPT